MNLNFSNQYKLTRNNISETLEYDFMFSLWIKLKIKLKIKLN
jgi:hypothetical protein